MTEEKQIRYDVDGFDVVTTALRELVNQYPGLTTDDEIAFALLDKAGKAMFPVSGAIVETEKRTVTGKVIQTCLYPFCVIYRAAGLSENRKADVKEWLDNLGRWLERQPVLISGTEYHLKNYPVLTGKREILDIARQTPAYLDSPNEDGSENWAIHITARYKNEYHK